MAKKSQVEKRASRSVRWPRPSAVRLNAHPPRRAPRKENTAGEGKEEVAAKAKKAVRESGAQEEGSDACAEASRKKAAPRPKPAPMTPAPMAVPPSMPAAEPEMPPSMNSGVESSAM